MEIKTKISLFADNIIFSVENLMVLLSHHWTEVKAMRDFIQEPVYSGTQGKET